MSSTLSSGRWVLPLVGFEARFGPTDLGAHFDFTVDISPTGVMALETLIVQRDRSPQVVNFISSLIDQTSDQPELSDGVREFSAAQGRKPHRPAGPNGNRFSHD